MMLLNLVNEQLSSMLMIMLNDLINGNPYSVASFSTAVFVFGSEHLVTFHCFPRCWGQSGENHGYMQCNKELSARLRYKVSHLLVGLISSYIQNKEYCHAQCWLDSFQQHHRINKCQTNECFTYHR